MPSEYNAVDPEPCVLMRLLLQLIEGGKRVRGPYLARLELHKRMRENNMNAKELLGDFADLIIEYFRFFGDKQCCTNDIALFLESISREERITVASKLVRDSGISSTTLPQNVSAFVASFARMLLLFGFNWCVPFSCPRSCVDDSVTIALLDP